MGIGTQIGLKATGSLARAGVGLHLGIERAFEQARVRRERAIDSVSELALRLREARRDQRAAEVRAARAEAQLVDAMSELRLLREALVHERRVSGTLKQICGV